jgi:hypothetical protein
MGADMVIGNDAHQLQLNDTRRGVSNVWDMMT